jgi:hypothetical protein
MTNGAKNQKSITQQIKTKNGKLEYEKGIWVTNEKDLKQQNKELYDELQVEKGKVKEIIIYID